MPQVQNSATDSENNVNIPIFWKTQLSESLRMNFQLPAFGQWVKTGQHSGKVLKLDKNYNIPYSRVEPDSFSLLLNHFSQGLRNYIINFSFLNFKDFFNPFSLVFY